MTAVYLRHADEAEGAFLADVPFDQLDMVIPTLRKWGIQDEQPELLGQFVYEYDKHKAYFEVVIEE